MSSTVIRRKQIGRFDGSGAEDLTPRIPAQADIDETNLVSFKNSTGSTLFTLQLPESSGGGNMDAIFSTQTSSYSQPGVIYQKNMDAIHASVEEETE